MKKRFFAFTLIAAAVVLANACSNVKKIEDEAVKTIPVIPKAVLSSDWASFGKSEPVAIENVTVKDNKMMLSVKYSGGCGDHDFQLVGAKIISKSLPPQRAIKLFHYNNEDDCRELVLEELIFDISALAYNEREITLLLENYETPISYTPAN